VSNEQAQHDRTGAATSVERRGNVRTTTHAVFTARLSAVQLLGGGRDISRSGAYFTTSDEIPCEVTFNVNGHDTTVGARIVRIDAVSPGTFGVAIHFDQRLPDSQLPA
jgi:hypothetical protein